MHCGASLRLATPSFMTACLLITACRPSHAPTLSIEAIYIPQDTTTLAGIRVEEIRKTPLYQKYASNQLLPNLDQFIKESGFDPRTDLNELLIAHNGKAALLIARGKFDKLRLPEKSPVKIINQNLALAGPEPLLTAALAQAKAKNPIPARLKALLDFIPGDAQLWAVSGALPRWSPNDRSNLVNLDKILDSVDSLSIWATLPSGLHLAADANAVDEAGAKRLQTQLKGIIGLGRLSTPDNQPQRLRFFDAIQTKLEGRSLHLTADITMDMIDAFAR